PIQVDKLLWSNASDQPERGRERGGKYAQERLHGFSPLLLLEKVLCQLTTKGFRSRVDVVA
ncbi:hypothetical protein NLR88_25825, partial [Escherichia coli]|nr:hypothetical protein [Escherichia coli]